uniref:Uncharacterized protein n=1 Tax=Sparus aurata TaxID=8175 RepID=A0A671XAS4_SPAAU
MHTLQRMMGECVCVVSLEGKLCDSVLRRSQKLKTQRLQRSVVQAGGGGRGLWSPYPRYH